MYETKISDARWMAYDIPGNIGWIAYFTALILAFMKKPELMIDPIMLAVLCVSVLPAIIMLVGIIELISERIHKIDRILNGARLYRGFGMLFYGGIAGAVISAIGAVYGFVCSDGRLTYLLIMLAGAILCSLFAGLIFKSYHLQKKENKREEALR